MRYGSVCSGMESATCAWHGLGWEPQFFSEIDAAPSRFLAAKFPDVPNHGDMTKFEEWPDHAIDLLVGGTPCQGFSIAGLRKGLDDDRSQLSLVYAQVVRRYRPKIIVWENVPGVLSSNGGRDFATFLGLLSGQQIPPPENGWQNAGIISGYSGAYGLAWRVLDAQYVRVDTHAGAVPQRRRRVFVVGYSGGDWRCAAAVLFEREGMFGHPAPRRTKGKNLTRGVEFGPSGGRFADVNPTLGTDARNGPMQAQLTGAAFDMLGFGDYGRGDTASTVKSRDYKDATDLVVAFDSKGSQVQSDISGATPTLRSMNADKSHQNGGGQLAVAYGLATSVTPKFAEELSPTLTVPSSSGGGLPAAVAHTLLGKPNCSHDCELDTYIPTAAFMAGQGAKAGGIGYSTEVSPTLKSSDSGTNLTPSVVQHWAVRRLTPTECLRLQGFPDDWFTSARLNKPLADGPMYKMIGNSMAVNVMRWLGERLALVEQISKQKNEAA